MIAFQKLTTCFGLQVIWNGNNCVKIKVQKQNIFLENMVYYIPTSPPLKTISPVEFMHKKCTIDRMFYRFIAQYPKVWRNTFQKEFFDEILLN